MADTPVRSSKKAKISRKLASGTLDISGSPALLPTNLGMVNAPVRPGTIRGMTPRVNLPQRRTAPNINAPNVIPFASPKALDQFGDVLFTAAYNLADRQAVAEADKLNMEFQTRVREAMYHPKSGYMNTEGEASVKGRGVIDEQITSFAEQTLQNASGMVRAKLAPAIQKYTNAMQYTVAQHTIKGQKEWEVQLTNQRKMNYFAELAPFKYDKNFQAKAKADARNVYPNDPFKQELVYKEALKNHVLEIVTSTEEEFAAAGLYKAGETPASLARSTFYKYFGEMENTDRITVQRAINSAENNEQADTDRVRIETERQENKIQRANAIDWDEKHTKSWILPASDMSLIQEQVELGKLPDDYYVSALKVNKARREKANSEKSGSSIQAFDLIAKASSDEPLTTEDKLAIIDTFGETAANTLMKTHLNAIKEGRNKTINAAVKKMVDYVADVYQYAGQTTTNMSVALKAAGAVKIEQRTFEASEQLIQELKTRLTDDKVENKSIIDQVILKVLDDKDLRLNAEKIGRINNKYIVSRGQYNQAVQDFNREKMLYESDRMTGRFINANKAAAQIAYEEYQLELTRVMIKNNEQIARAEGKIVTDDDPPNNNIVIKDPLATNRNAVKGPGEGSQGNLTRTPRK